VQRLERPLVVVGRHQLDPPPEPGEVVRLRVLDGESDEPVAVQVQRHADASFAER
jgi:hypothetical protein